MIISCGIMDCIIVNCSRTCFHYFDRIYRIDVTIITFLLINVNKNCIDMTFSIFFNLYNILIITLYDVSIKCTDKNSNSCIYERDLNKNFAFL